MTAPIDSKNLTTSTIISSGIHKSLDLFLMGQGKNKGRKPDERYASFDYCYNYFYSFYKENKLSELANERNLQMSCLQIGFYLASWGMLRGSSFLLEKSVGHFKKLIVAISKMDPKLWKIDVGNYSEANISLLLDCKEQIIFSLGDKKAQSDTLTTKIMLGVFANVPAFDQYFRKSMKVHSFNRKSLLKIKEFYDNNKHDLDSFKIHTFDFFTSQETDIVYSKAKLIDMCGFMDGR
ncbi:MAG: hypothetical protein ABII13_00775 [Patescibacteria group bacterium]